MYLVQYHCHAVKIRNGKHCMMPAQRQEFKIIISLQATVSRFKQDCNKLTGDRTNQAHQSLEGTAECNHRVACSLEASTTGECM